MNSAAKHYLTYQHNVQRLFKEHRDKYDGVIIPFSIAAAYPTGTRGFVRALFTGSRQKQYGIDPRTALFQKTWNRDNVRKPHERIAEILGSPFKPKGLSECIEPQDFAADNVAADITRKCLAYQLGFRNNEEDERKLNKYKKLLGLTELDNLAPPQFLVPPYFQFSSEDDSWFSISLRCIEFAKVHQNQVPIRPVLHCQTWASIRNWQTVWQQLQKLAIDQVWLYPNNFREHDSDLADLKRYRAAVEAASASNLSVFALFGGYFALLLSYFGLQGFANGIGYGEWRDSGYHKGGSAETRVYVLKLHRYLDPSHAQVLIERDSDYFAGDTELLSACVAAGRPLTTLTQAECLDHFLECRKQEFDFVGANHASAAVAEINETLQRLDLIGPLEREKYGESLEKWRDVLGRTE